MHGINGLILIIRMRAKLQKKEIHLLSAYNHIHVLNSVRNKHNLTLDRTLKVMKVLRSRTYLVYVHVFKVSESSKNAD